MRVVLDQLGKSFGTVTVLKDFTLTVEEGEFLVLLGPSGCGKTTALRMLAGLETVDSGTIQIGKREVTHILPKYRDIAMVFQSYALYPHMTVEDNIGYPLKVRGQSPTVRRPAVEEAARQVQLGDYLDRYPRQLSGGQRQRVALARAIVRRPSLFLMDEPLSNLDAKLRGHMRAELKHLQATLGTTTIYVTHDQIEAMTLAHRVAVMDRGVIQQLDTPRAIYGDPANLFVAGFIGSPPMNFLEGAIVDGVFRGPGVQFDCRGRPDQNGVVMGVRPEDTRVADTNGAPIAGTIYSVELTGDETIVTVSVGERTMVSRMDKSYDQDLGKEVGVVINSEHVYFFDKSTGKRLRQR